MEHKLFDLRHMGGRLRAFVSILLSLMLVVCLCPPLTFAGVGDASASAVEAATLPVSGASSAVLESNLQVDCLPVLEDTGEDEASTSGHEAGLASAEESMLLASGPVDAELVVQEATQISRVTVSVTGIRYNTDGSWTKDNWLAPSSYEFEAGTKTALEIFKEISTGCVYETSSSQWGESVDAISKGGLRLGMTHDGPGDWDWSYWSFYVDGGYASEGAGTYQPKDGETISLVYYKAVGSEIAEPVPSPGTDPDAVRPAYLDSPWSGFAGDATVNNAVTDAATPTDAAMTKLAWSFNYLSDSIGEDNGYTQVSEPIIVDGSVVIVKQSKVWAGSGSDADATIYLVDAATGAVKARASLGTSTDYTCRPVYAEGLIIVPVTDGRLQALTADTLTTVWISGALPADASLGAQQSISTLVYDDGYVYAASTIADWSSSYGGTVYCVDVADGSIVWKNVNNSKGYYWTGAALAGSYLFYAGDDGILTAVDKATGAVADSLLIGSSVRSSISAEVAGNAASLFFSSSDGVLHKVAATLDAALGSILTELESGSTSFAASSNSTPTVSGGHVFIGGAAADYSGVFSVIDAQTMQVLYTINLPAQVQGTPLVSTGIDGQTYAYFTANAEPGGIYVYRLGDTSAQLLFTPTGPFADYCLASVIAGADGTLYYTNDSSTLFALRPSVLAPAPVPDDPLDNMSGGSGGLGSGGAAGSINLSNAGTVNASGAGATNQTAGQGVQTSGAVGKAAVLASDDAAPLGTSVPKPWQYAGLGIGAFGLAGAAYLFFRRQGKVD